MFKTILSVAENLLDLAEVENYKWYDCNIGLDASELLAIYLMIEYCEGISFFNNLIE